MNAPHIFPDAGRARWAVRVRGAVQGVGFRPFVWTLAQELSLAGHVLNDADGVLAEIEGEPEDICRFLDLLQSQLPPLARIDEIETATVMPLGETAFSIAKSAKAKSANTMITPDMATCEACRNDILDPDNRRHRYAFTNCTHCGPRYTITRALPYDRAETSMASFAMCPSCQGEYDNPADRRFHAQPNACPSCGPQLSHSIEEMVASLSAGQIVALKGLGGFHLVVDAHQEEAVARLRARKMREGKPLAVMVPDLVSARRHASLSPLEEALLTDRRCPIVVCARRPASSLARSVSGDLNSVGLFLPYTPLHILLLDAYDRAQATGHSAALVMTSANPGGEPLVIGNDEAHKRLGGIADLIVTHDRDIVVRCDDSVVRVINGTPAMLRRARGYTPEPIRLPFAARPGLAVGAHLKNAVCVVRGNEAFLSQHIGDLDNSATYGFFEEAVRHLTGILEVEPEWVACDLHPDFLSTRFAEEMGLPCVRVQHHHAHLAAVAGEHGVEGAHLGLALDGFGLGDNGESWGGELMLCDGAEMRRLGGLEPLLQPGGDAAAREPWRMGAAALHALGRSDEIAQRYAAHGGAELLASMLKRRVHAPATTSAGRLFDAACGLLNVRPKAGFDGDAPMALEALVTSPTVLIDGWRITPDNRLDLRPLLRALCDMTSVAGANLFHGTFAAALADWIEINLQRGNLPRTVLAGGGCFQNRMLTEALTERLATARIELLRPVLAPPSDGGLALGQAFVAAHHYRLEKKG